MFGPFLKCELTTKPINVSEKIIKICGNIECKNYKSEISYGDYCCLCGKFGVNDVLYTKSNNIFSIVSYVDKKYKLYFKYKSSEKYHIFWFEPINSRSSSWKIDDLCFEITNNLIQKEIEWFELNYRNIIKDLKEFYNRVEVIWGIVENY